jgi:hypothetical protein
MVFLLSSGAPPTTPRAAAICNRKRNNKRDRERGREMEMITNRQGGMEA